MRRVLPTGRRASKHAGGSAVRRISDVIGNFPYRMALAGGWIDQPFVSRHNPKPPGSMVVVGLEPTFPWMDRAGLATSTRRVALQRWGYLPRRNPTKLVEELYAAENKHKLHASGSQDMIGLIYPGVNRLDYDYKYKGGVFPRHIESNTELRVLRWLENVIHVIAIGPRPEGYDPLGKQNSSPSWVARLGQTGKDCYKAIADRDVDALGASMNECMLCWETLLPNVVRHPAIEVDLVAILKFYQSKYPGAMYSGCGGGYLYVASDESVPGAFRVNITTRGVTERPSGK